MPGGRVSPTMAKLSVARVPPPGPTPTGPPLELLEVELLALELLDVALLELPEHGCEQIEETSPTHIASQVVAQQ